MRVHVGERVSKVVWESVTPPCWVFFLCEASRGRKATVCCVCTVRDGLLLLTCMWSTVPQGGVHDDLWVKILEALECIQTIHILQ